jgi:hypothetical protein
VAHLPDTVFSVFVDLNDLATAVEAVSSHEVTTMTFTGLSIGGDCGSRQCVVRTAHVALGTGLAVLLYCHGGSPV